MDFVNCFPTEVSSMIFSYLDVGSLLQASLVCKNWRNIVMNLEFVWKKKCLTLDQISVNQDKEHGIPWKTIAILNYGRNGVKRRWLQGRYSNLNWKSPQEIPKDFLCKLDVDTWGRILDAEFSRTQ